MEPIALARRLARWLIRVPAGSPVSSLTGPSLCLPVLADCLLAGSPGPSPRWAVSGPSSSPSLACGGRPIFPLVSSPRPRSLGRLLARPCLLAHVAGPVSLLARLHAHLPVCSLGLSPRSPPRSPVSLLAHPPHCWLTHLIAGSPVSSSLLACLLAGSPVFSPACLSSCRLACLLAHLLVLEAGERAGGLANEAEGGGGK